MNTGHLEIGIIQAFLDGELAHESVAEVSSHVGACNECASILARAEDESALVFAALDNEFNSLVPTQRLWTRINDSIIVEKKNASVWQKALAFVRASLVNPSIAVAAGLILVVGITAMIFLNSKPAAVTVASGPTTRVSVNTPSVTTAPSAVSNAPTVDAAIDDPRTAVRYERAAYRPAQTSRAIPVSDAASTTSAGYLPGEESYVKTIDTLSKNVTPQKDGTMGASERVSYERDMAIVDNAIARTRAQIKKNPKNESAKQILYSSYQNKIDLLNSVSQKEELMASIGTR